MTKVDAAAPLQKQQDVVELVRVLRCDDGGRVVLELGAIMMPDPAQLSSDVLGRQHEVHMPGIHCALWHAGICGRGDVLRSPDDRRTRCTGAGLCRDGMKQTKTIDIPRRASLRPPRRTVTVSSEEVTLGLTPQPRVGG